MMNQWVDATPANVGALPIVLYNVYGVSSSNIWVGGDDYVLHYDGNAWSSYKVADSVIVGSITADNANAYFTTYSPYGGSIDNLYKFSGNGFRLIQSTDNSNPQFGLILWGHGGH